MENKDFILENIVNIRTTKGIAQKQIEDVLGIKQGTYSKLENGKIENYFHYLPKIAQALGVSFYELVKNEAKINQTNNYQKGGTALHIEEGNKNMAEKVIGKCEETIEILKDSITQLKQDRDNYKRKYEAMKAKVQELEKKIKSK